jgi:hypothetical protein
LQISGEASDAVVDAAADLVSVSSRTSVSTWFSHSRVSAEVVVVEVPIDRHD